MTDTNPYTAGIAALPAATQPVDRGPLLGTQPGPEPAVVDPADYKYTGGPPTQHDVGVYADTVFEAITGLDPVERGRLAIDMFVNAPGAYRSIDQVFDDNGDLDMATFADALDNTLSLAAEYGPGKYGSGTGSNSEYLQILLRDPNRDQGELLAEFEALRKAHEEEKSGGGRVINWIDPVALSKAAVDAFSSVTGRKATAAEQKAFVKQIHGLQASGATGIQVGARAADFAAGQAPAEAKGMQYASAASALMKAIGL